MRALRLAVWAVVVLLLTGNGVRCVRHGWYEPPEAGDPAKHTRKDRGTDFTAYYSAGELARQGRNIYDFRESSTPFRPYIYPPMFAIFPMLPLALLPHNLALAVFYVLNAGLLVLTCVLLMRLFWPRGAADGGFWRSPEAGLLVALLVCGRFLDENLKLGQANLIILFLVALGLYLLARARPLSGGLAVALATVYKLTPGLFGLYLLWSRRGWAMVGGALGLALFLGAIPSAVLGVHENAAYLQAFAEKHTRRMAPASDEEDDDDETVAKDDPARANEIVIGWGDAARNRRDRGEGVSFTGTFKKLAVEARTKDDPPLAEAQAQERAEKARIAKLAAYAASALLLALTVVLTWPRWAGTGALPAALSWGLVAVTALLIAPLTRKAHLATVLIPTFALAALLLRSNLGGPRARKAAWAGLLALGATATLTSQGVIGDAAATWCSEHGALTWAMLAFYAATAVALWSFRGRAQVQALDSPAPAEPAASPQAAPLA
ncbi:MAG: DUF2029 domain-containing protein [Planctomycetes bacterium]|nr:DUF2029 domain-containing protein [Planctomycetota bacterium]